TPVFEHHHRIRTAEGDVADCPRRLLFPRVIDDRGDMARYRAPDRTRFDRHHACVRTKDEVAFGLPEYLIDRNTQDFVAPLDYLLADRLATRSLAPKRPTGSGTCRISRSMVGTSNAVRTWWRPIIAKACSGSKRGARKVNTGTPWYQAGISTSIKPASH